MLLHFTGFLANSQSLNYHQAKADSLFQQKRYTQSLELYQSIFERKQYSPAMLLKMAYMEEGLGHIATTLYYLNLYYRASKDERVISKINELATRYGLSGYDFTDAEQLLMRYEEHHHILTAVMAALVFILFSLMTFQRWKKSKPVGLWAVSFLVLTLLFIHTNFPIHQASAIISNPNTYLMNGPSSGSSVIQIVQAGHRVSVLEQKDVWVKVRWNNRDVYVKQDNLLPITL